MTVDFREHFWGDRNTGFELLYRNAKQSHATAKELVDFVRERSQIEESYSKLLAKLASSRLLGSASSVAPLWAALRSSTEKAASVHAQLAHQLADSVKELVRYADEQHRRHKAIKDEEAQTMEAVQALQQNTLLLSKAREACESRRSGGSEGNELKRKKALDDFRTQGERYEQARLIFIQRMGEACTRFQVLEENHLSAIKSFIDNYIHTLVNSYALCASMCSDLQSNVDSLSIEALLERFCADRGTGRDRPEPHKPLQDTTPPLSSHSLLRTHLHSQSSEDVFRASGLTSHSSSANSIQHQQQQAMATSASGGTVAGIGGIAGNAMGGVTMGSTVAMGHHGQHPHGGITHQSSQSTLYEFLGRNLTLRGRNKSTSKSDNNSPEVGSGGQGSQGSSNNATHQLLQQQQQQQQQSSFGSAAFATSVSPAPFVDEDGFSVPPPPAASTAPASHHHKATSGVSNEDSSSDDSSDDEAEFQKKLVIKIKPISEAVVSSNLPLAQPARLVSPPAKMTPQVLSPEFNGNNGNRTPPVTDQSQPLQALSQHHPPTLPRSNVIPRPPSRRSVDRSSPSPMTRAESVTSIGSVSTGGGTGFSRGPSPLTLGYGDTIPVAVAFQEVVHASFRGAEESLCQVRIFGDMKMSFPVGILGALLSHPSPPQLVFSLGNLPPDNLVPNSLLVNAFEDQPGTFRVEMAELLAQLKRLYDAQPGQTYFNVDLMKYSLAGGTGASLAPLHLVTYWNCDSAKSDLKVDYLYNATDRWAQRPCNGLVTVTLPPTASVSNVHSKPPCSWNSAAKKASWKVSNIKAGSILARFQHEEPLLSDPPGEVAAAFSIEDACFSDASFTLAPACGYRLSLIKRRIISGRYTAIM
ncbi:F-BAR domain only protein 2-like [Varroa destructor]|uniref:MHD domain-containing protein n=1 Tax=Varroa destructor TaxID=109461 RepID=A0A7M7K311_VARDE|nr:F-BAR domain only protein 2-like [Varroa destructor]